MCYVVIWDINIDGYKSLMGTTADRILSSEYFYKMHAI